MAITKKDLEKVGVTVCAGTSPLVFEHAFLVAGAMREGGFPQMVLMDSERTKTAGPGVIPEWIGERCGPQYSHWQVERLVVFEPSGKLTIGLLFGFSDQNLQMEFRLRWT